MNFFTSIVLGSLMLLQSVTSSLDICCELPKLPNLIDHYEEQSSFSNISFINFLSDHYVKAQPFSGDYHHEDDHDGQLPFHGTHNCSHGSLVLYPVFVNYQDVYIIEIIESKANLHFYDSLFSSTFLHSIFQPPKA